MQRHNIVFVSLISLLTFCSCKEHDKIIENKFFHVDLENCKNSIDLKLSDVITDCRLVPLETTNESLLGGYINIINVSGDYIIIASGKNVYKFSKEGKFINKILKNGRGPGEISGSCRYFYNKNNNLLFFEDDFIENDYIKCYDVKSETFLPSIKKCFQGRWLNFIVYQDSLIMGSVEGLLRGETNQYAVFIQDFEGRFIEGIKSNRTFIIPRSDINDIVLQRFNIYTGDRSIHVKYHNDDTLFTLKDKTLSVYLIPEYRNKARQPNMMPFEGDRNTYYDSYENPAFMMLYYSIFSGWSDERGWNRAHYTRDYYILNKSNGKYALIKSYYDDFTGKKFNLGKSVPFTPGVSKEISFPSSLPNNTLYVTYSPYELLNGTSDQRVNGFSDNLRAQADKIKNKLNETDNPVLLIGVPKNNLQILK
jgi:hypothetical protein